MAISALSAQPVAGRDDTTAVVGRASAAPSTSGCGWWCPGAIGRATVLWLGGVVAVDLPAGAGLRALRALREQDFAVPALVSIDSSRGVTRILVVNESTRHDVTAYQHLGIRVRRNRWLIVPSAGMDWGAWRRVRAEEVPEGRAVGPCMLGHALTVAVSTVLADAPTLTAVAS